ncbi:MAG TPA: CDGSH iron-sulfur domain-containing protein [Gemmataceae bacterium]|nr:CDGSH iron-sulfur domain-containing protein [Gemmataceae bacterium]
MPDPHVIRCRENGPLILEGAVMVMDHLGNAFVIPPGKETVALCRCGHSNNKPFCDGSHRQCGFQAAQLAKPPDPSGV